MIVVGEPLEPLQIQRDIQKVRERWPWTRRPRPTAVPYPISARPLNQLDPLIRNLNLPQLIEIPMLCLKTFLLI
jgi:hypothetical protein